MTQAGRSLFIFGFYPLIMGVLFITVPGLLVSLLGLPPLVYGWAAVLGLMALSIGTYHIANGARYVLPYIETTIYARAAFALGLVLLIVTGQLPPIVLGLAAIDAIGAFWTWRRLQG